MHAIELSRASLDAFESVERPDPPAPGHGQILVRMRAASLNFLDLAVATGRYPGAGFPLVPVADGAGEVIAIGDAVEGLAVGDRVAVHPKARWAAGHGTAENAAAMRGVTLPGALQQIAILDASSLVRAPAHLDWAQIASLPIAATTAWNALACADIGPASSVVVLGTGSVSLFALQLAKARGARVIVTSSSDEKLAHVGELGADRTINYQRTPEWDAAVLAATDGVGADLVIETVGAATFARSLAAVRQGGTVFTIGFLTGTALPLDLSPIIVKAIRVQGSNTGSAQDLADAVAAIRAHRIEPVIGLAFPVDRVRDAYAALTEARHIGKIALDVDW
jgi:NADPH:quinone reductase-like Zn-dependent oxidoreductase